jgi:hypothetical protein
MVGGALANGFSCLVLVERRRRLGYVVTLADQSGQGHPARAYAYARGRFSRGGAFLGETSRICGGAEPGRAARKLVFSLDYRGLAVQVRFSAIC